MAFLGGCCFHPPGQAAGNFKGLKCRIFFRSFEPGLRRKTPFTAKDGCQTPLTCTVCSYAVGIRRVRCPPAAAPLFPYCFLLYTIPGNKKRGKSKKDEYIDYCSNSRIQSKTKWMPPPKFRQASIGNLIIQFGTLPQKSGYISNGRVHCGTLPCSVSKNLFGTLAGYQESSEYE